MQEKINKKIPIQSQPKNTASIPSKKTTMIKLESKRLLIEFRSMRCKIRLKNCPYKIKNPNSLKSYQITRWKIKEPLLSQIFRGNWTDWPSMNQIYDCFSIYFQKNPSEAFNGMINADDKCDLLYEIYKVKLWDLYFYDWFWEIQACILFKQVWLIHAELYNKLAKQVLKYIC